MASPDGVAGDFAGALMRSWDMLVAARLSLGMASGLGASAGGGGATVFCTGAFGDEHMEALENQ
ncbi:hypothetical protein ASC87_13395 [Rhizobacter sp. Root1221]|nr:hypothetical protein ASC87_13395 [Rhizobacter sp. Root1221]